LSFEAIQQNHKDLAKQLKDYEGIFARTSFKGYLGQTGIDGYNEKIGHKSDDINAKGVNQIINEYCQQNSTKDKKIKLPKMAILYKQILSDVEDKFKIDAFEDDRQMLETIQQFYLDIKDSLEGIKTCLGQYLTVNNIAKIFLKKDSLTDISQKLWGNWGFINSALEKHADETLKLKKKKKEEWLKNDCYAISEIQQALESYCADFEEKTYKKKLADYFTDFKVYDKDKEKGKCLIDCIENAHRHAHEVLLLNELDKDRREPTNGREGGKGFLQVEKIKELLDSIMEVVQFARPLYLVKSGKAIEVSDKCPDFYDTFDGLYRNISACISIYNKTRNHVTKKPYSIEKFKINFENSTLLDGWDINKETANSGILLLKDGRYYLGIMRKDTRNLFDYNLNDDDSTNKKGKKERLRHEILSDGRDSYYLKMRYKQVSNASTDIQNLMFTENGVRRFTKNLDRLKEKYLPANVNQIRTKRSFNKGDSFNKDDCIKFIDYYKQCAKEYWTWCNFNFKNSEEYEHFKDFSDDIDRQGYQLSFDKIKASYINEKVKAGEFYLFEIYSKDFSSYSKGRPNLHTSYWKLLFSPENLNDLVLKLNGQAEIFFRPTSINKNETPVHKARQSINNKNQLNPKKQSSFDYDIVKDRRFTADKFFFHCPITLNFQSPSGTAKGFNYKFNDYVNEYLKNNPDITIIGIDRGERHLLYYSVINTNGQIIEQESFNTVSNKYNSNGKDIDVRTDYHKLLDDKEKQRGAAQKSWSTIENIKELKSGYLSHIVHKIASLMINKTAIVVLEDLNKGFKRGRFKVEKQVYQKFEQTLIDKLNYLVFKNNKPGQAGHYLSAYQLTAPITSFKDIGKQSGFLFYIWPNYTSKIDPVTGFVNLLGAAYESVKKSQEFFRKFDNIVYNAQKDYFEFSFNYANFPPDKSGSKKDWTVCTAGKERYRYDKDKKEYVCYDVTAELKRLFKENNIDYKNKNSEYLKNAIANKEDKAFFKRLHFLLGLTLQLRHIYKDGDEEKDFILSPVADKNGIFFDSRKARENQPKDADANGAFNIARKGLIVLNQINEKGRPQTTKNTEWFDFAQKG